MAAELKERTFQFSLRIVRLVESLPASCIGDVFGRQLLRCTTSVGANYRAACRAKSDKDFLSKMNSAHHDLNMQYNRFQTPQLKKLVTRNF